MYRDFNRPVKEKVNPRMSESGKGDVRPKAPPNGSTEGASAQNGGLETDDKLKNWKAAGVALRQALAKVAQKDGSPNPTECATTPDNTTMLACSRKESGQFSSVPVLCKKRNPHLKGKLKENVATTVDKAESQKVTSAKASGDKQLGAENNDVGTSMAEIRDRIKKLTANIPKPNDSSARKKHFKHQKSHSFQENEISSSSSEAEQQEANINKRIRGSTKHRPRGHTPPKTAWTDISVPKIPVTPLKTVASPKSSVTNDNTYASGTAFSSKTLLPSISVDHVSDSPKIEVTEPIDPALVNPGGNHLAASGSSSSLLPIGAGLVPADSVANLADVEFSSGEENTDELSGGLRCMAFPGSINRNKNDSDDSCSSLKASGDELRAAEELLKKYEKKGKLSRKSVKVVDISDDSELLEDMPELLLSDDDEYQAQEEEDEGAEIESKVKEEIDSLPDLRDSGSESSSDEDADDEFECDCAMCQVNKTMPRLSSYDNNLLREDNNTRDSDNLQYFSEVGDGYQQPFTFDLAQISSLDLLLMRQGSRDILQAMFQNVIMQMLAVYPDLLGDQAPPPVNPAQIEKIPTLKINQAQIAEESTCPICLCRFQLDESAKQLQCQHIFHILCIQAWLNKSGTCPVCRHVLEQSPTNT